MDKKCKVCGRINPLWSDEYCNIGCAYKDTQQQLTELKQHLREIETVTSKASYEDFCPACNELEGHKPDCWLAQAIKE